MTGVFTAEAEEQRGSARMKKENEKNRWILLTVLLYNTSVEFLPVSPSQTIKMAALRHRPNNQTCGKKYRGYKLYPAISSYIQTKTIKTIKHIPIPYHILHYHTTSKKNQKSGKYHCNTVAGKNSTLVRTCCVAVGGRQDGHRDRW